MAKKRASCPLPPPPVFSLGDRVDLTVVGTGTITELRGPLGPNGEEVYRVVYRRKPSVTYIEVTGRDIKPAKPAKPAKAKPPAAPLPPA